MTDPIAEWKPFLPAQQLSGMEFTLKKYAGRSVNGGGNQSFLRQAAKAAGCADGSRCPSAGRIFSMAEQV
jgi:hypothetical protein